MRQESWLGIVMLQIAVFFAMVWLALPAASGAVTLSTVSQDREVSVAIQVRTDVCPAPEDPPIARCDTPLSTTIEDYADAESAPDFGDFSATAAHPDFPLTQAIQNSSISATALTVGGSWDSHADASFDYIIVPPSEIQFIHVTEGHTVESRYEVSFELDRKAAFSLTGGIQLDTTAWGEDDTSEIALLGPGATAVASVDVDREGDCDFSSENTCSLQASISQSGQLGPGIYTLRAYGHAEVWSYIMSGGTPLSTGSHGSFDVALLIDEIPVPALPPGGAVLLAGGLLAAFGALRRRSGRERQSRSGS